MTRLLIPLLVLSALACHRSVSEAGAARSEPGHQGTVVGHLEGRGHRVTISTAGGEPRYTVRSSSGEIVAWALTEEELERRHPELYQSILLLMKTPQLGYVD